MATITRQASSARTGSRRISTSSCNQRHLATKSHSDLADTRVTRREGLAVATTTLLFGAACCASADAKVSQDSLDNLEAVKKIIKAFSKGDLDRIVDITAESAVFKILGPKSLPYTGTYSGKTCFRDAINALSQYYKKQPTEVFYYVGENQSVVVNFDMTFTSVTDPQRVFEASESWKVTVRDGQLVKVALISDTLAQYQGLQSAEEAGLCGLPQS